MQTKKVLIIIGGLILAIIIAVILIVSFSKKQNNNTSNGGDNGGGVSTGGGGVTGTGGGVTPLPVGGNGGTATFTPTVDPSSPFATTLPRVNAPSQNGGKNNTPLNSNNGSSTGQNNNTVAYNYNQSNNSFLAQYYPDAQQVINGGNGPSGNVGQDPSNQVVYTSTDNGAAPTGPNLQAVPGFDEKTLHLSSDNSTKNILAYLNTLHSTIASFDTTQDTGLMTDPLQSLNAGMAKNYLAQGNAVLAAVQKLTVPSSIKEVEEGYVDNYQRYNSYMSELQGLIASVSSGGQIKADTTGLSSTTSDLSTSAARALSNYQNATSYYSQQ